MYVNLFSTDNLWPEKKSYAYLLITVTKSLDVLFLLFSFDFVSFFLKTIYVK